MSDEFETTDEPLEDAFVDSILPDDVGEEDTEPEKEVSGDTDGVVWVRGDNGKLERA